MQHKQYNKSLLPVLLPFLKGDGLLLLTASIWGFAFVAQRIGMKYIQPFTFNGVRFALGSLSLLPLWFIKTDSASGKPESGFSILALYGLLAGSVLFLGVSLQQVGIVYTTAGKAGFITGLYVVLVPLSGLFWGQKPGLSRWLGALLAVTGLYFLSITGNFTISRGDFLVLVSAFFWAAHVQIIGWLSPKVNSVKLASIQFAVCSILSLTAAFIFETVNPAGIVKAAVPIIYGGLFSVGIAYTLQIIAQKTAQPTHAAIIMSLEGVFAVLGGWVILGETLSPRNILGCILMLAGMILAQAALIYKNRKSKAYD
ncbi:MAG: DMT family transporter [Spirochaetes bacterium]|nr:DMT family transporter [Spirochaetota bacterium]